MAAREVHSFSLVSTNKTPGSAPQEVLSEELNAPQLVKLETSTCAQTPKTAPHSGYSTAGILKDPCNQDSESGLDGHQP